MIVTPLSLLQSRQVRGAPDHAASRTPPVITRTEACPRGHGLMDLHYANWERFCRYHVGDWYGLWTPYTVDGVALTPRQCLRSFQRTTDGRAIAHQNHYRYADGRQETTTFGPYTPATSRGVFVEASFSWGSPAVAGATPFAFETGFRAAERRVSLVVRSDAHGGWQPLVVITEHLGRCAERPRRWRSRPSRGGVEASVGRSLPTCGSPPRSRSHGAGSRRWVRT